MGKIIILGDSIAYGKWDREGGWVARLRKYIDQTYNFGKNNNFQVYNLGIPSDVVVNLQERAEEEIKSRMDKFTNRYLIIYAVGINDSCLNNRATGFQTREPEFKAAYKKIISIAKNLKCRVICVGLTPVNEKKIKELEFSNKEVEKYDQYISQVCQDQSVPKLELFVDLKQQKFPDLLVDSVHPNNHGHKILFTYVQKFLQTHDLINHLIKS